MPNVNCAAVMASLVVASTNLFNALAFAHQNRDRHHGHHHKNQKQKSYNKGYQWGYNKAYEKHLKKTIQILQSHARLLSNNPSTFSRCIIMASTTYRHRQSKLFST